MSTSINSSSETSSENFKPSTSGAAGSTAEPKKSARLAEKRKLREESEPSPSTSPSKTPIQLTPPAPSPTKIPPGVNRSAFSHKSQSVSPLNLPASEWTKNRQNGACSSSQQQRYFLASDTGDTGTSTPVTPTKGARKTARENASESSEEEWLDALESGTLDELVNEELRGIQNPDLRTSRQKALVLQQQESPTKFEPPPAKDVLTQEMIIQRAAKSQKRRLLAQQKKEIDKKRTMDRLLKKQHLKIIKPTMKPKDSRNISAPKIRYLIRADYNTISFTSETQFLIDNPLPDRPLRIPEIVKCGIQGCQNPKKYNCSKTTVPLCSLECYKINLENSKLIETSKPLNVK